MWGEQTCQREGCDRPVHPSYVKRYESCCSPSCYDVFESEREIDTLRAELARVTEERDLYRDLLAEARETHDYDYERDPWAGEADECPCAWCDDVRAALERLEEGE